MSPLHSALASQPGCAMRRHAVNSRAPPHANAHKQCMTHCLVCAAHQRLRQEVLSLQGMRAMYVRACTVSPAEYVMLCSQGFPTWWLVSCNF